MITLEVLMEWNEPRQEWLMKRKKDGIFLYEYRDCGNVRLSFPRIDKTAPKTYKITVEEVK